MKYQCWTQAKYWKTFYSVLAIILAVFEIFDIVFTASKVLPWYFIYLSCQLVINITLSTFTIMNIITFNKETKHIKCQIHSWLLCMQICKVVRVIFNVLSNLFILLEYIFNDVNIETVSVYYVYSYIMEIGARISSFCFLGTVVFLINALKSSFNKVRS